MYKVTVITVTFNAEKNIAETMYSVLNQKFDKFEYIIKDGESTDQTNIIVEQLIEHNKKKSKALIKHIRSKDAGIYHAMNEAVHYASGEWIIFMNAGDCFYNENVLADIFDHIYEKRIGVLFGHVMVNLTNNRRFVITYNPENMKKGYSICHQTILERRSYLLQYPFDEKFKILSDRDHFLLLMEKGVLFQQVNMIITREDREGLSSVNYSLYYQEEMRLNRKHNLLLKTRNIWVGKMKKIIKKRWPLIEEYFMISKCIKRMR